MQVSKYLNITRANSDTPHYAITMKERIGIGSSTLYITLDELKKLTRYGIEQIKNGGKLPQRKTPQPKLVLLKGEVDE